MDSTLHEELIRTAVVASAALGSTKLDFGPHNLRKFSPPEPDRTNITASIWARVEIQNTQGSEAALGLSTIASYREGALFIALHVPREFGRKELDVVADAFATYFHWRTLTGGSGLMFVRFVAAPAPIDVGERGVYYRINQRFRFYVEDRTA